MARRLTAERFIGRADLLDVFDEMLESAHAGRGDVLLIGGEAGVGKSRAIGELTTRAQRDGAVVLVGWCVENGEQVLPLAPVADILRGIATLLDASELDRALGMDGVMLSRWCPTWSPPIPPMTVGHGPPRGGCSTGCWMPCGS